jgi:tripartite-type tricarboxylate transporter receptor subunit TctC
MKIELKKIVARVSACIALAACAVPALAANAYPDRQVNLIVAFGPGGTNDILARMVAQQLTEKFKQAVVVQNKPGAGGNIGSEYVARSTPDGYTVIVDSTGPIAVNPTLYHKLGYNPLEDLVPVVQIAKVPNVLVVNPALPIHDFAEFVQYAKSHQDTMSYGSTGVGTSSHLSSFLLMSRLGVRATHVPYKGADSLTDLIAGRVQFMFDTIPALSAQIHAGKLRAIAIGSTQRSQAMPDVPTVMEGGVENFQTDSWFGIFAPKGTPKEVVAQLNKAVNDVLPSLRSQMLGLGAVPTGGTSDDFRRFVHNEYAKWRDIVTESHASAN